MDLSKKPCKEFLLSKAMIELGEIYLCEGNWRDLSEMVINSIIKYAKEDHKRIAELEAQLAKAEMVISGMGCSCLPHANKYPENVCDRCRYFLEKDNHPDNPDKQQEQD